MQLLAAARDKINVMPNDEVDFRSSHVQCTLNRVWAGKQIACIHINNKLAPS
jgi:hypothetical protein